MQDKIIPKFDYLLCKEIKEETGVVTPGNVADHWQKYEVLAAGEGRFENGKFVPVLTKVGDVILVQKHAEADTPEELKSKDLYLIMDSRVMAVVGK